MSYIQQSVNLSTNVHDYTREKCQQNCDGSKGSAGRSNCSDHCAEGCKKFLEPIGMSPDNYRDPALNATDLCCHYTNNEDYIQHTCCSSEGLGNSYNCAQTENMNTCFVVSDREACSQQGHEKQICGRSCSQRCTPDSVDNFFENTPQLQIKNCWRKDGHSENFGCIKLGTAQGKVTPWQFCIYDTDQIRTRQQLDNYIDRHGTSGPNYNEVMVKFCSDQVSGSCPTDPMTGKTDSKCARYFQGGDRDSDGFQCKDWINKMNPNERHRYLDSVGSRYCSNYNTSECSCVNRGRSLQYQELKGAAPWNDGCWFTPCTDAYPNNYFRPVSVDTSLNESMCPVNYCATILNVSNYNEAYIKNNEQYINCSN